MNIKTTIILVAVLIVVGLVAFFVNETNKKGEEKPAVAGALFDMKGTDLTKITVAGGDGKKLVVQKTGGDWHLVEPIDAPADNAAVDRLATAVAEVTAKELEEKADPGAAGLSTPAFTVTFVGKEKTHTLKVGKGTGVGDQVYVQAGNDGKIELASADLLEQLQKPLKDFRQTRLLDKVAASSIQQIQITQGNEKLTVQKQGQEWKVTSPESFPGEAMAISDLTFAATGLTASEFVDPADVVQGLNPNVHPQLTVWLSESAPTTQPAATQPAGGVTLKFGGFSDIQKKNVFVSVSNPPTLAIVPASALESFQKKPLDLRDRRVLDIDPAQVSRIAVTTDTPATTQPTTRPASHKNLAIERKKEAAATRPTTGPATQASTQPSTQPALPPTVWALRSPTPGDASQAEVETLLGRFHPLRVEKYIPTTTATTRPASKFVVEITTEIGGQTKVHHLEIADPGENKPLVGSYNGLSFELDRSLAESFGEDYANKPVAAEPPAPRMPPGGFPGFPGR